jgi:hypothetical protein
MAGDLTMTTVTIDNTLFLQVRIAHKYMARHNLTIEQFRELDRECDILSFLEIGYEPYHLTGDEGVLDEIDEIVEEQLAAKIGISPAPLQPQSSEGSRRAPNETLLLSFLSSLGL